MGQGDEHAKLVEALYSAFLRAHERGWRSVSFPGVSSGIFSVPHVICADAYLDAVNKFWDTYKDSTLRLIRLVLFDGPLLEEILRLSRGLNE
jgi:O-acetyl-ADP-ribose deacetylase (regulator of RNase III)